MRAAPLVPAVLLLSFAAAVPAQGCGPGETFWKRDALPAVPGGQTAVSVVQGVCEGESAGVVFELPAGMAPQRLTQVVAPWGAVGGVAGYQAQLDVMVFDGVGWSGGVPVMGTPVFQLSAVSANAMQVASHGLNTFDLTPYNAVVGLAPPTGTPPVRRFAVCFRVDLNAYPSTCGQGYQANFFTDNPTFTFSCNTPLRTSLIEIQGQGWRDAATAAVSGVTLCPFLYNGIWCIRACSTDAFPASYTTFAPGCAGTLGVSHLIPATLPRIGTNLFVVVDNLPLNLGVLFTGASDTTWSGLPLPLDLSPLGATGCWLRAGPDVLSSNLIGGGTTASVVIGVPNQLTLLGMQAFQQALVLDPINGFGAVFSDAAVLTIGN